MLKISLNLRNLQLFLFYLLPLFAISGPFLTDFAVVLISLSFIYKSLKEKRYYFYNNAFFIFFLIWYLIIIFSSLISSDPLFSLESSLFYLRFGFFALAVWQILEDNSNAMQNFTFFILFAFLILILDGYLQFFRGYNIFGYPYHYNHRLGSLFGTEHVLGKYLAYLFPLVFALVTRLKFFQYYSIISLGLLFIFTDILIYISGERSAFALLMLSSVSILILTKNWKMIRLVTLSISFSLIILISFTYENVYDRMIDLTLKQTNLVNNTSGDEKNITDNDKLIIFTAHHQIMYSTAINMFIDKPYFGVGPKMYRKLCSEEKYSNNNDSCSTHPHNYYVQLLAETGIIGTIPLLAVFIFVIFTLSKHLVNIVFNRKWLLSDFRLSLIICILVSLWPIIPSGNFFNNWLSFLIYLPIGFLIYDLKSKINNK